MSHYDYLKGCIRCEDGVGDHGGFVSHSPEPHEWAEEPVSKPFPCVRCGKFNTVLGQARCKSCQAEVNGANELKEYGHTAEWCPERIDVSTYAERAWIHGPCNCKEKQVPEVDLTFTSGGKEYHIKGDMHSVERESVGRSPSGTERISLELWGTVETKALHRDSHFQNSRHQGLLCGCYCPICYDTPKRKCLCPQCTCAGRDACDD